MNRLAGLLDDVPKQKNRLAGLLAEPEPQGFDARARLAEIDRSAASRSLATPEAMGSRFRPGGAYYTPPARPQGEQRLEARPKGPQITAALAKLRDMPERLAGSLANKAKDFQKDYIPTGEELSQTAKAWWKGDLDQYNPSVNEEFKQNWRAEVYARAQYARDYIVSLGGNIGPAGFKEELRQRGEEFTGLGSVAVPATVETAKQALEWAYLIPAMFKGNDKLLKAVEKLPVVKHAKNYIGNLGGIKKLAEAKPQLYNAFKDMLKSVLRGGMVGTEIGGAEAITQGMPPMEALDHAIQTGKGFAAVASMFSGASSVDKALYLKRLEGAMRKRLDFDIQREAARVNNSGMSIQAKTRELRRLREGYLREGLKYIEEIRAAEMARLYGATEGSLYKNIGKEVDSSAKAAERFMQEGMSSVGKVAFRKAPDVLRGPKLRTEYAKRMEEANRWLASKDPKKQEAGRILKRMLGSEGVIQSRSDIINTNPDLKVMSKRSNRIGNEIGKLVDRIASLKGRPGEEQKIDRLTKQIDALRAKKAGIDEPLNRRVAEIRNQQIQEGRVESTIPRHLTEAQARSMEPTGVHVAPEVRPQSAEQVFGKSKPAQRPSIPKGHAPASPATAAPVAPDAVLERVVAGQSVAEAEAQAAQPQTVEQAPTPAVEPVGGQAAQIEPQAAVTQDSSPPPTGETAAAPEPAAVSGEGQAGFTKEGTLNKYVSDYIDRELKGQIAANQQRWDSTPRDEQNQLAERFRKNREEMAEKIIRLIETKDPELLKWVSPSNKFSRMIFEKTTGIKLPPSIKKTQQVLTDFVGKAKVDALLEKEGMERTSAKLAQKQRKLETAGKKQVRFENETMTVSEMIDRLLDDGYVPIIQKKGAVPSYRMEKGDESIKLDTKLEYELAEDKLQNRGGYDAVTEQATSSSKPQSQAAVPETAVGSGEEEAKLARRPDGALKTKEEYTPEEWAEYTRSVIDKKSPAPAVKEPWQMTREEFLGALKKIEEPRKGWSKVVWQRLLDGTGAPVARDAIRERAAAEGIDVDYLQRLYDAKFQIGTQGVDRGHEAAVQQALFEGKPVPAEVLAEYPDLTSPASPATMPPVTGEQASRDIAPQEKEKINEVTRQKITQYPELQGQADLFFPERRAADSRVERSVPQESAEEVGPRPLVNPRASAVKQDQQLKAQQAWDKKYGKVKYGSENKPAPLAEGDKSRRRKILQDRIKRGEAAPAKLLREFAGEEWADRAIAEPTPTTAPVTSQEAVKKKLKTKAIEILPRKDEIIAQLTDAIKVAPNRSELEKQARQNLTQDKEESNVDFDKRVTEETNRLAGKLHFEIDGGVNVYNTKQALNEVLKSVKAMPEKEYPAKSPTLTIQRPVAEKKEELLEVWPTEDKSITTDGRIMIKQAGKIKTRPATDNKGEPITRVVPKKQTDELFKTKGKPAELHHFYIRVPESGTGVSSKPIANIGEKSDEPLVEFKSEYGYSSYKQNYFNIIRNRYPNAKYLVAETGMLIAEVGGKRVAVLMPINTNTDTVFTADPIVPTGGLTFEAVKRQQEDFAQQMERVAGVETEEAESPAEPTQETTKEMKAEKPEPPTKYPAPTPAPKEMGEDGFVQGFPYKLTGEIEEKYGAVWLKAKWLKGPNEGKDLVLPEDKHPDYAANLKSKIAPIEDVAKKPEEKGESDLSDAELLAQAELKIEAKTANSGRTYWSVTGRGTYNYKDVLTELGAAKPRKIHGKWVRSFFDGDPTRKIADAIRGQSTAPASESGQSPDESGVESMERIAEQRSREDARPDRSGIADNLEKYVTPETRDLIQRGVDYNIPQEIVDEQKEDVALAIRAFESESGGFILANEAGTGKTFVLGGIIRELQNRDQSKIYYITQKRELIEQIKDDLKAYGIDKVQFFTYAEIRKSKVDTKGAVLIFDESQSIKNTQSQQGKSAQDMIKDAKFSVFASATPYENPIDAAYLDPTGIFKPVGGHHEWAKMYGATVITRKYRTSEGEQTEEILRWDGGISKREDLIAAREWLRKQGLFTQREKRLPDGYVTTEFKKKTVDTKWLSLLDKLSNVFADAETIAEDSGDYRSNGMIRAYEKNLYRRVLEAAKIDQVIERAKAHAEKGRQVVIFTATKADRHIGRFANPKEKGNRLYTYPEMEKINDSFLARNPYKNPPFAKFIMSIAESMYYANIDFVLPSVLDDIETSLGKENIAYFTGAQTEVQNINDLRRWKKGKVTYLVATMDKGGTGLSLHDTTGKMPQRVQIGAILPWNATQIEQTWGRLARYGLSKPTIIETVFADNVPFDAELARRVGRRMSDMNALVKGVELSATDALESFDFEDGFNASSMKIRRVSEETDIDQLYRRAESLEKGRKPPEDKTGDFFPTPYPVAVFMAQAAGIRPSDVLLEPSAGEGNLIRLLPVKPSRIDAVEMRQDNARRLQRIEGADIHIADFMEWDAVNQKYDIVLMNPPFSRLAKHKIDPETGKPVQREASGWQDMLHIKKAYDLLADGGRLVAIQSEGAFFRDDAQSQAYREWLDEVGAQVVSLPRDTFKKSGTSVKSRLIIIDKDGEPGVSHIDLESAEVDNLKELADTIIKRQGSTFSPDPKVEVPPRGEGGFVRIAGEAKGRVLRPWLDDKKVQSPNKDIEGFFGRTKRPPYVKKASKLIDVIKTGLRERFVTMTPHIPSTPETAIYRDMIRTLPEEVRQAGERAVRDIINVLNNDGTVEALDSVGLDLLRRKVFIADILNEAELDRSVSGGFSKEELEAENQRLDALIEKVPSVRKAYENRQKLWRSVSEDLLERGVLDEETAANQHYVRHFVLDLAEKNGPTGFKRKRLSEPYRAYKKQRKGSTRDISTDYLEVEVRALAQIYKDNAVEDVANKIGDLADRRKAYAAKAKAANFESLVGGPENVKRIRELRSLIRESQTGPDKNDSDEKLRRKQWIQELTDLDPTYPYRQRIAMHMAKFKKGTDLGDIEEDGALFRELAKAAKDEPQSERGMAARGVFKAMAERDKMIRDALGGGFMTPERLAGQEGYVEWHYKRPNLFYRAHTLTESQIAALVESSAEEVGGVLQIPKAQLRQALVLGRRKGMIIPDWLAAQLDDLPVNRRSPYVVRSFTKPFVQFWKRWILRVNPLRYNFRNQIGDTERLNASGQNGAIKSIPRAVRLLISKEGEYYDLMKKYGVIGSTLWHEMNDVSTIKEFERFKDYSKNKTLRQAAAKAFMLPLKTVSKIGSIEQNLTQLREDILRAAVFIDNYEKLQAGRPVRHWAGKAADIDSIAATDKARAAAKISRETLGDYGDFTPFEEDFLRQGLVPFYSWMKINTVFWPRVLINAAKEGAAGRSFGAAATVAGINVAKWLVRALWVYAAAYLWNHRDEEAREKEEALPHWLRAMPHINVGDTTIWGQTALSDFAEWADYESLAGIAWRYDAGYLSRKEAAMEAAKMISQAQVNKLFQSLNPYIKATFTGMSGLEPYPNVFEMYRAASPMSRKSFERAVLDIMGTDAKKFYQSATGDRKFEDTLYAYFAGWWGKPTDPDTLADEILKTKEWSSLKRSSPTTGRKAGQAKAGKEREWQEAQMRAEAVGPEAMRRARRRSPSRMTAADIEKLLGTGSEPTGY